LHLLFWLSLVPFATRWMGESGLAPLPTAIYGCVLLLSAIAFSILVRAILPVSQETPSLPGQLATISKAGFRWGCMQPQFR